MKTKICQNCLVLPICKHKTLFKRIEMCYPFKEFIRNESFVFIYKDVEDVEYNIAPIKIYIPLNIYFDNKRYPLRVSYNTPYKCIGLTKNGILFYTIIYTIPKNVKVEVYDCERRNFFLKD